MPYHLVQVSPRGWKVIDDKGRFYSKKSLSKKRAGEQMKALYVNTQGAGLIGDLIEKLPIPDISVLVPRRYSKKAQRALEQYGGYAIQKAYVRREPIQKAIDTMLNFITDGKLQEAKQKFSYDKLFHLGLVVEIKIGANQTKEILIEKNETINITDSFSTSSKIEKMPFSNSQFGKIRLIDMLNNAQKAMGDDNYFLYDAFRRNCQNFIAGILKANRMLTKELEKFIDQRADEIIKELPQYTGKVANLLTDLASIFMQVFGKGERTKRYWIKGEDYIFVTPDGQHEIPGYLEYPSSAFVDTTVFPRLIDGDDPSYKIRLSADPFWSSQDTKNNINRADPAYDSHVRGLVGKPPKLSQGYYWIPQVNYYVTDSNDNIIYKPSNQGYETSFMMDNGKGGNRKVDTSVYPRSIPSEDGSYKVWLSKNPWWEETNSLYKTRNDDPKYVLARVSGFRTKENVVEKKKQDKEWYDKIMEQKEQEFKWRKEKQRRIDEWNRLMEERRNSPMGKFMDGLVGVADFLVSKVAPLVGVPPIVTEMYKTFAPPPSEYYKPGSVGDKLLKRGKELTIEKGKKLIEDGAMSVIDEAAKQAGLPPIPDGAKAAIRAGVRKGIDEGAKQVGAGNYRGGLLSEDELAFYRQLRSCRTKAQFLSTYQAASQAHQQNVDELFMSEEGVDEFSEAVQTLSIQRIKEILSEEILRSTPERPSQSVGGILTMKEVNDKYSRIRELLGYNSEYAIPGELQEVTREQVEPFFNETIEWLNANIVELRRIYPDIQKKVKNRSNMPFPNFDIFIGAIQNAFPQHTVRAFGTLAIFIDKLLDYMREDASTPPIDGGAIIGGLGVKELHLFDGILSQYTEPTDDSYLGEFKSWSDFILMSNAIINFIIDFGDDIERNIMKTFTTKTEKLERTPQNLKLAISYLEDAINRIVARSAQMLEEEKEPPAKSPKVPPKEFPPTKGSGKKLRGGVGLEGEDPEFGVDTRAKLIEKLTYYRNRIFTSPPSKQEMHTILNQLKGLDKRNKDAYINIANGLNTGSPIAVARLVLRNLLKKHIDEYSDPEFATDPAEIEEIIESDNPVEGMGRKAIPVDEKAYLKRIHSAARKAGYDPKKVSLADNGIHKIKVIDENGKAHYAGRIGYNDFHIYSLLEKEGKVEKGVAQEARRIFRKSHEAMKGKWRDDKYSPNNLALAILW